METGVLRSITFTKPQLEYLKAEAKRLGISVSELVRRTVDNYREPKDRPEISFVK